MYRRGTILPPPPPSPWSYLLGGLGQGISQALAQAVQESQRRKSLVSNILESAAFGGVDPAIFATQQAQDFFKQQKIGQRPEIRGLVQRALESFAPQKTYQLPSGAVGNMPTPPPPSVTMEAYQQRQAEKAAAARQQKFYGEELPETITKEAALTRLRKEIEQEFEETPEQVIMHVAGLVEGAKKNRIPLQGLTYKGVDVLTAWEKAKYYTEQTKEGNVKALAGQGKYYKGIGDTQEYKTRAVNLLTGLKAGTIPDDEANKEMGELKIFGKSIGLFLNKSKRTPEDLKRILIEQNRTIKAKNAENRVYAREGLMKPGDVEEVEPISDDILSDIEPTTTTKNPSHQLMTVTGRGEEIKGREPGPAEVEAEAQKLLGVRLVDPDTGQIMTMSKARQIARQYLLKRQKKGYGR